MQLKIRIPGLPGGVSRSPLVKLLHLIFVEGADSGSRTLAIIFKLHNYRFELSVAAPIIFSRRPTRVSHRFAAREYRVLECVPLCL